MPIGKPAALATLGLLLAAAIVISHHFAPHPDHAPEADLRLAEDARCDLQEGPCRLPLPGSGSLSLSIEPRPIRPLETLRFSVVLDGQTASDVVVDFQGVGMNMGITRFRLTRSGDGFEGTGKLPVCIRSRMAWRAEVWLRTVRNGTVVAPFVFSTLTPSR